MLVDLHAQAQSHLRQDLFDLIEALAAKILGLQHLAFRLLHQLADGLNIGVLQAVIAAHGEFELLDRTVEVLILDLRLIVRRTGGLHLFFKVDEDVHVVLHQLCGQADGIGRAHGTIGPDFQRELVIVRDLPETSSFHGVVAFAHRRVHGIDGNKTQPEVFLKILVGSHVAASALESHFHVQLATFAHGRDVNVLIEDLNVAVGLDHAAGHHARLVRLQVDGLGAVAVQLEGDLLKVEDDIGGVFYDAGDGLELMHHAFDAHRGDRCAFDGGEQYAPQRIADGGAESALERLRIKAAVSGGECLSVCGKPLGFLKTFPKHSVSPCVLCAPPRSILRVVARFVSFTGLVFTSNTIRRSAVR